MNGKEEITLEKIKGGQTKLIADNIRFQEKHKERTSNVIKKVDIIESLLTKLKDIILTNRNDITWLKRTYWIIIGAVLTGTVMGTIGFLFFVFKKIVIE